MAANPLPGRGIDTRRVTCYNLVIVPNCALDSPPGPTSEAGFFYSEITSPPCDVHTAMCPEVIGISGIRPAKGEY
jgi:hypothetical protein